MNDLSIIVPVYNSESYIRNCIDSIIKQEYKSFEIILVDDGSTDSSYEICKEFERDYNNIKCIHQSNRGACLARFAGAKIATGKYLGFIDSDDYISSDYYKVLINYAKMNDADIVTSGFSIDDEVILDEYGCGLYEGEKLYNIYQTMIFDTENKRSGMLCSLCTKIIRKELYLDVLEETSIDFKLWEDLSYFYKIVLKAKKIYISNYVGYYYRQHLNSTSHAYNEYTFEMNISALEHCIESYANETSIIKKQLYAFRDYILFAELNRLIIHNNSIRKYKKIVNKHNVSDYWGKHINDDYVNQIFTNKQLATIKKIQLGKIYQVYICIKIQHIKKKIISKASMLWRKK